MGIRVLIVDDEKLERVLILKALDWEREGFEIVGEAGNGEEALEFYQMKSPELIITDINMPYMDGVQLAEEIKKRDPQSKIVMVTGYREFEYARKALRIGVEDFLLKPINIDEIQDMARKIKKEIEEQKGHRREYDSLKEKEQETQYIILESFLQRLVENRIEEEEALRKLKVYNLDGIATHCICMNVKIEKGRSQENRIHGSKLWENGTQENRVQGNGIHDAILYDIHVIYRRVLQLFQADISFVHYMENLIFYFREETLETVCEYGEHIRQMLKEEYGITAEIGISSRQEGFPGISRAYRQTEKAVAASVILGRNRCITYEEYEKAKATGQEKFDIRWKDFIFYVESGVRNRVEEEISRYCNFIRGQRIVDRSYIRLMGMDMISKASTILSKHGRSMEEVVEEDLYERIIHIDSVDELEEYLKKVLGRIMEYADSIRAKKGNSLIESAKKYIDEHLHDCELSLKTVAGELYVNESYLSRSFKQETGESLIEYITRNRIEQSIELLNTTDMKAYEISEYVGIKDPHYFSICFKKQMGVTIKEYKNREIT
ncbi:MAG: response regulator [Lachnospiraceae bacterium]|nr:response regulator [Lachnospiraceae bacterium]